MRLKISSQILQNGRFACSRGLNTIFNTGAIMFVSNRLAAGCAGGTGATELVLYWRRLFLGFIVEQPYMGGFIRARRILRSNQTTGLAGDGQNLIKLRIKLFRYFIIQNIIIVMANGRGEQLCNS